MNVIDFLESTNTRPQPTPPKAQPPTPQSKPKRLTTTPLPGLDLPPEKIKLDWRERLAIAKAKHEERKAREAARAQAKLDAEGEIQVRKLFAYRKPELPTPHETEFRHSAWAAKREQVGQALTEANSSVSQLYAFSTCGSEATICYDQDEKRYFMQGKYCHCRFCEPCMRAKANLLAANFREITNTDKPHQFRFLTLTLKHSDAPLKDQIKKLRDSFVKLRKTPMWETNCEGGAGILEIKWDKNTGEWHPHFHVIMQGDPIQKQRISDAWNKITGGSFIIDIRALDSRKDAAYYIAKYVAKGSNLDLWYNRTAAVEFVNAMRGQRSMFTFGCWRGLKLLRQPPRRENWTRVGSLTEIIKMMVEGSKWARDVLDHIHHACKYDPTRRAKTKDLQADLCERVQ
jgi:Replication protein